MIKKIIVCLSFIFTFVGLAVKASAQHSDTEGSRGSTLSSLDLNKIEKIINKSVELSRLQLGGYGEIAMTRNFFNDNFNRYSQADIYKNMGYHNRFDLPHVTFFVGYEFGNGWRINSEIEFEHGGAEIAVELEAEESGEYETEVERGGEVALEQFWIEKAFSPAFNLRFGHIIVPVGYTNGNHLPTQFFTVYRPEGENTILPCTWHETGVSLWGRPHKNWRYELLVIPGLDSELFSRKNWIQGGSASPYEFKVANKLAGVARLDNYSVRGLRLGVSGYMGESFRNSVNPSQASKYDDVKGSVYLCSFDFDYHAHNVIARGYFDYGHLMNSKTISNYNKSLSKYSPSPRSNIASDALCAGVEVGYDVFSQITMAAVKKQKFYLFGRYEYYDSMFKTDPGIPKTDWCQRQKIVGGINYFPISQIVFKAEYSAGILKKQYNNENSLSFGIAYAGYFLK